MKRSFAMLAKNYEVDKHIVNGWMVSEKLDGCRAMWLPNLDPVYTNDPESYPTGLWTRDGKVIHAPNWWLAKLPNVPLDGELWLDRRSFQTIMSYVRKKTPDDSEWEHIKFVAFDMPVRMEAGKIDFKNHSVLIPDLVVHNKLTQNIPFRFVYKILTEKYEENEVFTVASQRILRHRDQLQGMLDEVVEKGGEGLMLRNPSSTWCQFRTDNLLKVKPTFEMEVTVMGYYYGDGKYYGMMGALEVMTDPDEKGNRCGFKVSGFTDEERKVPSFGLPFSRSREDDCVFRVGDRITITYRELTTNGIPKEARYKR